MSSQNTTTTTTLTPVEVDAELGRLHMHEARLESDLETIDRYATRALDLGKDDRFAYYHGRAREGRDLIAKVRGQIKDLENQHAAAPWTRYWATTAANWHIHSTMGCSTCGPRTQYEWLTDHSGRTANDMITKFQTRMCSSCFPDAPLAPKLAPPAPRTDRCNGTPAPGQGARIKKKCSECNHIGSSAAWRAHKPKH